jgi:hypothetical protein
MMMVVMMIGINADVNVDVDVTVKETECSDCEKTRDVVVSECGVEKECGNTKDVVVSECGVEKECGNTKDVVIDYSECDGCEECMSCKKSCNGKECNSCTQQRSISIPTEVCEKVKSTTTFETTSMREVTLSSTSVETLYSTVVETYYSTIIEMVTTETPYVCAVETEVYSEVCTTEFKTTILETETLTTEITLETGIVIVNDSDRGININNYTGYTVDEPKNTYATSASEKLVGILVVILCVFMV